MGGTRIEGKIKAVFSEENYDVPKATNSESASMLTALYCVTKIQAEIHQLFQGKACTNTILVTFKLQSGVVTLNILRSRSFGIQSNNFCQQCIGASLVEKNPLVQETELRKG